jgi:Flp pilus assembly protein TadG
MRSIRRLFDAGRRAAAAFLDREDGGPAAEFALVAPIFIVIIYATIQCAIIYIASSFLETGTETTARQVLTNQSTNLSTAQFKQAVCNNLPALFNCGSLMIGIQPANSSTITTTAPTFNSDGSLANTMPYQQPQPGQIGVLQVVYQWPVIGLPLGWNFANLGNGTYLMMSTQVFRVEPQ